jgi:hypothetical protein
VVSDGLRFQIQRVSAVLRDVIVEGGHLLFARTAGGPAHEGLANAFGVDLDRHPAGPVIDDYTRRVIVSKVKSGIGALHRNQSPGSYQLLSNIVLARLCGEQGNACVEQAIIQAVGPI